MDIFVDFDMSINFPYKKDSACFVCRSNNENYLSNYTPSAGWLHHHCYYVFLSIKSI